MGLRVEGGREQKTVEGGIGKSGVGFAGNMGIQIEGTEFRDVHSQTNLEPGKCPL